jgi:ABC-2 type transport system ATP-binding protein
MSLAIEVSGLKKKFRERGTESWAVRGIGMKVRKGEIYGFLGPNGAGKSTTIFILSTLVLPTSGKAEVLGFDVVKQANEVRARSGICVSGTQFYYEMYPREILNYYGMLFGMPRKERKERTKQLIADLDITPFQNKYFGDLSTGMKQKVAIAKSLMNSPEILFLDEPTAGLDVEVARDIRQYISDLARDTGMTVLLTSHQLYEVEEMCRDISVINKGKIVAEGDIKSIRKKMGFPDIVKLYLDRYTGLKFLEAMKGVLDFEVNDGLRIEAVSSPSAVPDIMRALQKRKYRVADMEVTKASLEDMFMKIVRGK